MLKLCVVIKDYFYCNNWQIQQFQVTQIFPVLVWHGKAPFEMGHAEQMYEDNVNTVREPAASQCMPQGI